MNWGAWDKETLAAYKAMREYRKAFTLCQKAIPSVDGARQNFDRAKVDLLLALKNPVVEQHINLVMDSRPENPQRVLVREDEREMEINFHLILV